MIQMWTPPTQTFLCFTQDSADWYHFKCMFQINLKCLGDTQIHGLFFNLRTVWNENPESEECINSNRKTLECISATYFFFFFFFINIKNILGIMIR